MRVAGYWLLVWGGLVTMINKAFIEGVMPGKAPGELLHRFPQITQAGADRRHLPEGLCEREHTIA